MFLQFVAFAEIQEKLIPIKNFFRLANVVLKCGDSIIAISPSMASNKHRL